VVGGTEHTPAVARDSDSSVTLSEAADDLESRTAQSFTTDSDDVDDEGAFDRELDDYPDSEPSKPESQV
jgi:hypothetical protein